MRRSRLVLISLVALLAAFLAGGGIAGANPLARPQSAPLPWPVVSYQGQVQVGGSPYSGTGYFKFAVVNAAGSTSYWSNDGTSGGGGEPTAAVALPVTGGLFTVLLGDTTLDNMTEALTAAVFSGPDRYLRVWFSSDGLTFTQLSPDRRIAAVPYALQAQEAANAALLNGLGSSAFQQHYQHVKVVAKSGGDYETIGAALGSISDNGAESRYLVWVAPGTYTETVTMKEYVDIEGAGELATKITYGGNPTADTGTVVGASNAELRFLTVENTGGAASAIAIYNYSASPRLTHVTATASGASAGGTNRAVSNMQLSAPQMSDLSATATGLGAGYAVGVDNNASPGVTMTRVSAKGEGAQNNRGVRNDGSSSTSMVEVSAAASGGSYSYGIENRYSYSMTMTGVTASASGAAESQALSNWSSSVAMAGGSLTASGSGSSFAVCNYLSSSLNMTGVTAAASGGSHSYGVYNSSSSLRMLDVSVTASRGTTNEAVYNYMAPSATLINVAATASGGGNSYAIHNTSSYTVTMSGVTAVASGATTNLALDNHYSTVTVTGGSLTASGGSYSRGANNTYSSITLTGVAASASGGINTNHAVYNTYSSATMTGGSLVASGGGSSYGVYNINTASFTMTGVSATASGSSTTVGAYNGGTSLTLRNCTLAALGAAPTRYGIDTVSSGSTVVDASQVSGATVIHGSTGHTVWVGASQLSGVVNAMGATFHCTGVYDGSYASYTCP